ncbi:MAG TPA: hypothetical protein VGJ32_09220 [Solirubrobacteraceae bacterium]|jgi:hypothetical protein
MADVRAPDALRARIEAERAARRARRRAPAGGLGLRLAAAAGVVALAAAVVLVIGLLGGGSGRLAGPSVAQAAEAALRPSRGPAPAEDVRHPVLVRAGIAGLRFPYWDDEFGLQAVSMRRDRLGGREAMTVEYRTRRVRVGYTIVGGRPLAVPDGARRLRRGVLPLAVLRHAGAAVVTWRRDGHTCVLASREASVARLVRLAAWTGGGKIAGYRHTR